MRGSSHVQAAALKRALEKRCANDDCTPYELVSFLVGPQMAGLLAYIGILLMAPPSGRAQKRYFDRVLVGFSMNSVARAWSRS